MSDDVTTLRYSAGLIICEGVAPGGLDPRDNVTFIINEDGSVDTKHSLDFGRTGRQPDNVPNPPPEPCHTVFVERDSAAVRVTIRELIHEHREFGHGSRVWCIGSQRLTAWVDAGCRVSADGIPEGGMKGDPFLVETITELERQAQEREELESLSAGGNLPYSDEELGSDIDDYDDDEDYLDFDDDDEGLDEEDDEDDT